MRHRQWGQKLGDSSVKTINAQFGLSCNQQLQLYIVLNCQTHLFYQHNGGLAPSPCARDLASVLVSPRAERTNSEGLSGPYIIWLCSHPG